MGFIESQRPKAAYIGASNDDEPAFYHIFQAAMESIGNFECRMITSALIPDDVSFLNEADIILLAGGDVTKGWQTFVRNGLREILARRYFEDVVLIGVSAGAVQLGRCAWPDGEEITKETLFNTFSFFPAVVSVHDENDKWQNLQKAVAVLGEGAYGIGIPRGGGVIYYADGFIEAIRYPVHGFSMRGGQLKHHQLLPILIEAHTNNAQEIEGIQ